MPMKQIYMKGTIAVLLIACILFALSLAKVIMKLKTYALRSAEKQLVIENNERKYAETLAGLERSIAEMDARFRIVKKTDLPDPEGSFPQISTLQSDQFLVDKYFNSSDRSISAVRKSFQESMRDSTPHGGLRIETDRNYVVDRNAAVLEGLARKADLKAESTIFWDMKKSKRWTETRLSSGNGETIASVSIGESGDRAGAVAQSSPETLVFPFRFDLMNSNEYSLHPGMELPLGGLYVHYFRVFCKGDWHLEYTLPEGANPEDWNLRSLSLIPNSNVLFRRDAPEGVRRFLVKAPEKEAAFLIVADRLFIPGKITAKLVK